MSDLTTITVPEQPTQAPTPTLAERDQLVVRRLKGAAGAFLLFLAVISFIAGTPGLLAAGSWAQLEGWMRWLTPAVVDGGLVFFSISAMAHRGESAPAGFLPWSFVLLLSAASVAAQATHVLGAYGGLLTPESVVGASVASLFPLVVLASTRSFETLRFGRLIEREAARAAKVAGGRARVTKPVTTRLATAAMATQPAAPAKPRSASHKATKSSRTSVTPAVKVAALARIEAGEISQRAAATELGVSRGAIQGWLGAA